MKDEDDDEENNANNNKRTEIKQRFLVNQLINQHRF